MDDYPMRKSGERNRLPHGERLQVNRNWMEDEFEELNARKKAADATLPGNLLATENIPGYVSQRQREMKRTSVVAKAAALPAGAAALYGVARLAYGIGGTGNQAAGRVSSIPKARPPISEVTNAARRRYQQMVLDASVHHGRGTVTFSDLFDHAHDNLFGRGTRLDPNGGLYRPQGIPLDDMDRIGPRRVPWPPTPKPLRMAKTWGDEVRGLLTQTHMQGGNWPEPSLLGSARNAAAHGWTAARGFISNPKHWANMGKGLGMGALGAGVTGGLNWAGGKMGVGGSDTYGGAAYGLFADAAGGATAGARGGPMGMAIGAVGGMAIGSGARLFGGLRDLHRATVGDDATHQQVSAAQQAMLQRQRERVDAMEVPAPQHRLKFKPHDDDAKARKYAAAMDAADAASRRWHTRPGQPHPIMGTNGKPAPINPATGLPWSSGQDHSIEGRGNIQQPNVGLAATFNAQHPVPGHPTSPAPNNAAVMPVARPAAGGGSAVAANGGDDTAIKNATAALDMLTTTAGKLNTAFAALATRADALFKAQPGLGNNGLQFQPTGQMGGSYPGKTH